MPSTLIEFGLAPTAVIHAQLLKTACQSPGPASLALDSAALVRLGGQHHPGCVALRKQRGATHGQPAALAWAFHGWSGEEVDAARARLALAWKDRLAGVCVHRPANESMAGGFIPLVAGPNEDLCLTFQTPFRYSCPADWRTPRLTSELFIEIVNSRRESLLGRRATLPDSASTLELLTHFGTLAWAGPRTVQGTRLAAFQGTLFLRGASATLVRLLADLQAWHLVTGRDQEGVVWRGAYELRIQRQAWLDRSLLKRSRLALSAQRLMSQQDTPPIFAAGGRVLAPMELADGLLADLRRLSYRASPTEAFDIHRPGHSPRRVERLALPDLLAQQHALRVLSPVFERLFEPDSFGFRPGRSRGDAIEQVRSALRDGYTHVLESDIANCFPSISHDKLNALLDHHLLRADVALRQVLAEAIRQPWTLDGARFERTQGLAQGAPLSPLLTNLMLTALDRSIDRKRFRYVRYADDFVVLARSKPDAQSALVAIQQTLGAASLTLAQHKTHIGHLREGFDFLGEHFGPHSVEAAPGSVVAQRKPMVITEPYVQLGVNGDALEVRRDRALLGVWPLRRLSELLVLERVNLSSALLDRCSRFDIPIALAQGGGRHVCVVGTGQRRFQELQHLHGCWFDALAESARLAIAKDVVDAKLHNQARLVTQRRGHDELAEAIEELRRQAHAAASTAHLRGYEGQAARLMFGWLQGQVVAAQRPAFCAQRRSRGGPDRLNSLLNFLYFLLYVRVNGLVRLLGLNPYLGWLHDAQDDYETLVYDLMEPFRPFIDRVALRLINRSELRASHFENATGQLRLVHTAARKVVESFEQALGERLQGAVLRELLWHQLQSVKTLVQGQGPLWLFRWDPRAERAPDAEPQVLTIENSA